VSRAAGEFVWPVRVYYEDTDAGGVVYYANYLKFMERARTEWLRELGFEQDELRDKQGVIFAVRHIEADYRRPAKFNDQLLVSVKMIGFGAASLSLDQAVTGITGDILCTGQVQVACLNAQSLRPQRLPGPILMELKRDC